MQNEKNNLLKKKIHHYPPLKVIVLRPCNVFRWQLLRLHGCCSQIAKISLESVLLLIGYSMPTWMSWKSGRISMILGRLDKLDSENNSINSNVNSNSVYFIFFSPSWSPWWNLETTSQIYHKKLFLFKISLFKHLPNFEDKNCSPSLLKLSHYFSQISHYFANVSVYKDINLYRQQHFSLMQIKISLLKYGKNKQWIIYTKAQGGVLTRKLHFRKKRPSYRRSNAWKKRGS